VNGAQDVGGMQAFGPIRPEADVSLFHADWERRVLAITLAMGATAKWNIDMSRAARESFSCADAAPTGPTPWLTRGRPC
jgi:nitrile hydratase